MFRPCEARDFSHPPPAHATIFLTFLYVLLYVPIRSGRDTQKGKSEPPASTLNMALEQYSLTPFSCSCDYLCCVPIRSGIRSYTFWEGRPKRKKRAAVLQREMELLLLLLCVLVSLDQSTVDCRPCLMRRIFARSFACCRACQVIRSYMFLFRSYAFPDCFCKNVFRGYAFLYVP